MILTLAIAKKLQLSNYQIFPVESRGIDFVGYKSYHTHIFLRDTIKDGFIEMVKNNDNVKSRASYKGWMCHANCINLNDKYYGFKKD